MLPRRVGAWSCLAAATVFLCSCALPIRQVDETCGGDDLLRPGVLEPGLRGLARQIDHLEKHVEKYGSVVPQHASVWGQARLMMHRHEFEREMKVDLPNFAETLQATVSTSDAAYLASALSLSAAASGTPAAATDASSLVSTTDTVLTRTSSLPKSVGFYAAGGGAVRLEPTTYEDQKKRFLDHLHELRRINEGDDNTDAPGYTLGLVRIPVSILPGDCTQTGFGAECTISATPHLPPDLLQQTFRDLVVNDLIGLLTLPTTRIIESDQAVLKSDLEHFEKSALICEDIVRKSSQHAMSGNSAEAEKALREMEKQVAPFYARLASIIATTAPASRRRVEQSPLPTSQLVTTLGAHNLGWLAWQLRQTLKDHLACADRAKLPAAARFGHGRGTDRVHRPLPRPGTHARRRGPGQFDRPNPDRTEDHADRRPA